MSTNELAAVVFDMDGLMFNTEDLYDEVGRELLDRRGQIFTRELKLAMMGLPGPDAFAVMIENCGLNDSVDQLQWESDQVFQTLLPEKIEMMPGLRTLLNVVDSTGLPRAVATSSHRMFADVALGHFDLQSGFQFVLTSADVTRGKPNPEIYLTAAERLGVEPRSVLVLEDSVAGSLAAARAGAYVVAVPTKYSRHLNYSHVQRMAEKLDDEVVLELIKKRQLPDLARI